MGQGWDINNTILQDPAIGDSIYVWFINLNKSSHEIGIMAQFPMKLLLVTHNDGRDNTHVLLRLEISINRSEWKLSRRKQARQRKLSRWSGARNAVAEDVRNLSPQAPPAEDSQWSSRWSLFRLLYFEFA